MTDLLDGIRVRTATDGDVNISVKSGEIIGLDATANTIKMDQTGSNNKVQFSNTAGQNEVDLAKIGGTAVPVPGKIAIDGVNSTAIPVNLVATSGTVKHQYATSAALASGASVTITFNDITAATTGKLRKITFASSATIKCLAQSFDVSATTHRAGFTANGGGYEEMNFEEDAVSQVGGTGKKFQVSITNLDNKTADVYASATWFEE